MPRDADASPLLRGPKDFHVDDAALWPVGCKEQRCDSGQDSPGDLSPRESGPSSSLLRRRRYSCRNLPGRRRGGTHRGCSASSGSSAPPQSGAGRRGATRRPARGHPQRHCRASSVQELTSVLARKARPSRYWSSQSGTRNFSANHLQSRNGTWGSHPRCATAGCARRWSFSHVTAASP
jgi:hypothetical protein